MGSIPVAVDQSENDNGGLFSKKVLG